MGNNMNKGLYTSATEEWETPPEFFRALDATFKFTLDPCASDKNHKTAKYYTKKEDGLAQSWAGETVSVNPPYGREISKWVEKAEAESKKTNTTVVCLLPARTDTAWFHDHVLGKAEVRFIRGRIRFSGSPSNAPFPSMLAIYNGWWSRPRTLSDCVEPEETWWEKEMEDRYW